MSKAIAAGLGALLTLASAASAADHMHHSDASGQAAHSHHMDGPHGMDMQNVPVSATVTVGDCWVRLLPEPAPSAGYFVVKNAGAKPVRLTGASAAAFGMVMLHQTTNQDGMSRMSMAQSVEVPAGQELAFKPGGYHAMLEQPRQKLQVGTQIPMEFQFDSGEKATASCEVRPANTTSR